MSKILYKYTEEGDYRYLTLDEFLKEFTEEEIGLGEYSDSTLCDFAEAARKRIKKLESKSKSLLSRMCGFKKVPEVTREDMELKIEELEAENKRLKQAMNQCMTCYKHIKEAQKDA